MIKYEACVRDINEAINAQKFGAHRIELCDNLLEGGTTPSLGMIRIVKETLDIPVNVIIRPRGGNFYFNDLEVEIMKNDIKKCVDIGVNGVVIGMLDKNNEIDKKTLNYILEYVDNLEVTFHMAFDEVKNPFETIDYLVKTNKISRILTRGGIGTAIDNLDNLKKYIEYSKDKIIILPGCGINFKNKNYVREYTGAKELHGTNIVGNLKK